MKEAPTMKSFTKSVVIKHLRPQVLMTNEEIKNMKKIFKIMKIHLATLVDKQIRPTKTVEEPFFKARGNLSKRSFRPKGCKTASCQTYLKKNLRL